MMKDIRLIPTKQRSRSRSDHKGHENHDRVAQRLDLGLAVQAPEVFNDKKSSFDSHSQISYHKKTGSLLIVFVSLFLFVFCEQTLRKWQVTTWYSGLTLQPCSIQICHSHNKLPHSKPLL